MKYLSDYTQDGIDRIMSKHGAFFAFNNKQFDEQMKEGVNYTSMGSGLITPKGTEKDMIEGLHNNHMAAIALDIAENGQDAIIKRELYNHECFYTGDPSSCYDALDGYGFSDADIVKVYREEAPNADKEN